MMFRDIMSRHGRRSGREARESRRDEYVMLWDKINNYWYRVGPKEEKEIKSSFNDDALKSVVRLLKLSKSTETRSAVYLVLRSACKNSNARKRVLSELLNMITCDKEKDTGATGNDPPVYASEGTIVRRALELFNELCKGNMSVAEALIVLPSPPVISPDSENVESSEPVVDKLLSLSTLASLLSTLLFLRSNVHLEQFLNVIRLVCRAFPSSRPSKTGSGSSRRSRADSVLTFRNMLCPYDLEGDEDEDASWNSSRKVTCLLNVNSVWMRPSSITFSRWMKRMRFQGTSGFDAGEEFRHRKAMIAVKEKLKAKVSRMEIRRIKRNRIKSRRTRVKLQLNRMKKRTTTTKRTMRTPRWIMKSGPMRKVAEIPRKRMGRRKRNLKLEPLLSSVYLSCLKKNLMLLWLSFIALTGRNRFMNK